MTLGRRSRSRSRKESDKRSWALFAVVAIAGGLIVAGFVVAPSEAFTTGSVDRGTIVPVVGDDTGFLGIDVTDSLQAGGESQLVTVTNNLNRTLTVDVSASAPLSNGQATLAPGASMTTTATVSCTSPPSELDVTVSATANGQFSGHAVRSASVDTSDCADSTLAFGTVEIVDRTTSDKGGKAEYDVNYTVTDDTGAFDRVEVDFENLDPDRKQDRIETITSRTQSGTISFESGGQRVEEPFEITVRLFDTGGELESERIVVTDTADGSGIVHQVP